MSSPLPSRAPQYKRLFRGVCRADTDHWRAIVRDDSRKIIFYGAFTSQEEAAAVHEFERALPLDIPFAERLQCCELFAGTQAAKQIMAYLLEHGNAFDLPELEYSLITAKVAEVRATLRKSQDVDDSEGEGAKLYAAYIKYTPLRVDPYIAI